MPANGLLPRLGTITLTNTLSPPRAPYGRGGHTPRAGANIARVTHRHPDTAVAYSVAKQKLSGNLLLWEDQPSLLSRSA